MSSRHLFTDDEWRTLQILPIAVGGLVGVRDGAFDESESLIFWQLMLDPSWCSDPLVRELLYSVWTDRAQLIAGYTSSQRDVKDDVAAAARVLDARLSPDQAKTVKKRVLDVAARVAAATGDAGPHNLDSINEDEDDMLMFMAHLLGVD